MFDRFTEKAIKVIMLAQEESRRMGHTFVGTEQILLGLIAEGTGIAATVLRDLNIRLKPARAKVEGLMGRGSGFVPQEIPFTPRAKTVIEFAWEEARQLGHSYISTEHILLGLIREGNSGAIRVLESLEVDISKIKPAILKLLGKGQAAGVGAGGNQTSTGSKKNSKTPMLEEFATNLTDLAANAKLDPMIGREKELERVIQILGRRTKNNPILLGEPGVGKTAIAEGLAQKIVNGDVPEILIDKRVYVLEMGMLVAGTKYRGEFEERMKKIMEEIRGDKNIILMIDEVHTILGAGAAEGAIDAANILKPALARGELQCIGATTLNDYRKYIEKDSALERRFQPVTVGEPATDDCIEILRGLKERYEQFHGITILDEAVTAAVKLSEQYIADRFLPDKAIDLLDEAASRVKLRVSVPPTKIKQIEKELAAVEDRILEAEKDDDDDAMTLLKREETELTEKLKLERNKKQALEKDLQKVVNADEIAYVVSTWTNIPASKLTETETYKLLKMEEVLHENVIGQEDAVKAVSRALRRSKVGLKNPNKPIGAFMFAGPTGVGKTELTKTLATFFFGSMDNLIRLDMSEYMERHTVSRLVGSPPGYVGYNDGGQLTEAVRRRPYSVILFDEVEKAHPDVFNMLLQILDEGRLTDSKGRTVSFKNTIVILTSNVGARAIEQDKTIGFKRDSAKDAYERLKDTVTEEAKRAFRPEFINRLDDIIVFHPLSKENIRYIVELTIKETLSKLDELSIKLVISDEVKDKLAAEGYSPVYGARPLKRVVQKLIEDDLAEELLKEKIKANDTVNITLDPETKKVVFTTKEPATKGRKSKSK